MIRQESVFIEGDKSRLHLWHVAPAEMKPTATPVLLVHGAVENSRVFYTASGKGLSPFLARHGFDTYSADLRGRGLSEPRISRESRHGQYESITQEIPAFVERIRTLRGDVPQLWMAHSWGGVLLLSTLARRPEYRRLVRGIVFFGTKRSIHVRSLEKRIKIDVFWNRVARGFVRVYGFLPARRLGIGGDDETDLSHAESREWVKPGAWVDPRDGFDYARALGRAELPPMFFLTGLRDTYLGNPGDVRALIRELGPQEVEFRVLGRAMGNLHDYGHTDILTHTDAEQDHFLDVLKWAREAVRGG